jgi:hypothetical protein
MGVGTELRVLWTLEGIAWRYATVAGDGNHEQTIGNKPDGHDAQEEVPEKGLLENRRQGAAEAPDLLLVGPEARQDEEHPGDDKDYPAGRDAEPSTVLDPPVLPVAQSAELKVLFELGVVGLVDLVQAHANDPDTGPRDEGPRRLGSVRPRSVEPRLAPFRIEPYRAHSVCSNRAATRVNVLKS